MIKRFKGKKGEVLEESPEEKGLSIFLLLLFIGLIIFFIYLVYRFFVSGHIANLGRVFGWR